MAADLAGDGSPVALYRQLPPGDDWATIRPEVPPGASVLDLGCGAGRLAHPIAETGCRVTAVDDSPAMLAAVRGCSTVLARIEQLRLDRRFDVVLLAGNLVNANEASLRREYLKTCSVHVDKSGCVLLQRVDPRWAATAQPFTSERGGVRFDMADVDVRDGLLTATVRYRTTTIDVAHRFCVQVLDDDEFGGALSDAGLRLSRWLDERHTWALAVPAHG